MKRFQRGGVVHHLLERRHGALGLIMGGREDLASANRSVFLQIHHVGERAPDVDACSSVCHLSSSRLALVGTQH